MSKRDPSSLTPSPLYPLLQRRAITARMHSLRLSQKGPFRSIGPDRLQRHRRHIAVTQHRLAELVDAVIDVHAAVRFRQPHLVLVVVDVEMLADRVDAVQAVQHVRAAVVSGLRDAVAMGRQGLERWEPMIVVEERYLVRGEAYVSPV